MDRELTRRERKKLQKMFEEKKRWRERKTRGKKPRRVGRPKDREKLDWRSLLDEETYNGSGNSP